MRFGGTSGRSSQDLGYYSHAARRPEELPASTTRRAADFAVKVAYSRPVDVDESNDVSKSANLCANLTS